jgi:hypothetical protein
MIEGEKIAAVHSYLKEHFDSCVVTDSYDPGTSSQVFRFQSGDVQRTAVVEEAFLEKNSAVAIPDMLRRFLLAEHLKECNFPIVVTPSGLSD